MNSVQICSRQEVLCVDIEEPHAFIAIRDSVSKMVRLPIDKQTKGILRLRFDDISSEEHFDFIKDTVKVDTTHLRLFTKEMAGAILDFWERTKDKVETVVVSCEAGISRSAAVGLFLSHISGLDTRWIVDGARYYPNPLVLKVMNEVWNESWVSKGEKPITLDDGFFFSLLTKYRS